jgi:large subunit ribosomal protein L29
MKIKELRDKSVEELNKLLLELCEKRRDFNFKIANKQLKNIRLVRDVRKDVARIRMTLAEKAAK